MIHLVDLVDLVRKRANERVQLSNPAILGGIVGLFTVIRRSGTALLP